MTRRITGSHVYAHLKCPRMAALDLTRPRDERRAPTPWEEFSLQRGRDFEAAYVRDLEGLVEPQYPPREFEQGLAATLELMRAGVPWIFQGVLLRGDRLGLPDLMRAFTAGEIHMFFLSLGNPGYIENIKAGKMKVMFFGGDKRNAILPDVPSMAESGVPDHRFKSWWGMAAPRGTPKEIIDRLHTVFVDALRTPSVQQRFTAMSLDIVANTPAEFAKFIAEDKANAERLVKTSGARLD